ncbi:hypothetical protein HZH68_016224 [Vespula germanica]|uniref:Uncharacterized protein n=1 Tax=Vespula germanica TaxID=30212 RepID=A0A834MQX6_VESGE|nr:hypothetical protein HZH68_016224 [Vespula germanica]
MSRRVDDIIPGIIKEEYQWLPRAFIQARLDGPVQVGWNEWLGPVNVTLESDFDNMTGIFHLSFPYQINNRIRQFDETIDIVFHAVLPHTLREVDIPYINVKKSGRHNSRNH